MTRIIGILTGGGDVPGLNPAMKAMVTIALDNGIKVYGIRRGWAGLLEYDLNNPESQKNIYQLSYSDIRTIDRSGGTFLHTSRTNPQRVKMNAVPEFLKDSPLGVKVDEDTMDYTAHVLKVLDHFGIQTLITIGGDDTLSFSVRLHKEGFPVIAIPKTMDNDVFGTDYCIGFSTAITRSVEVITNMRTSLGSHERIGVIELFGRNSGETSLLAAYLSGADRAVIPEVHFNIDKLTDMLVEDRRRNPSNYSLTTISEGAIMEGGDVIETGEMDAYGHRKLGGVGMVVAEAIKKRSNINIMYQQVGYMMRSGAPDSLDRMVATSYGNLAAQLLIRNDTGRMVALHGGKYTTVPVNMVLAGKKCVDVPSFYDIEEYRPHIKDFLGVPMFLS
ncbi:MAG TPA: ATP-dependent 6-phosphofructokinase [Flexilinea sp.]|jgi:6-phosphofructokinase 1|nr:ATP-dependent 6-phosphofructokinase [Flexilinea sp.]OQA25350.1 MAG: Pyrophosphate--fructose 6-phosphate 1-phosphotransferase [Chloroflexi bacterium ADurb.Bin344]HNY93219.1 ATP-dependent 6-phosphofructokinase [Flexilinea sp.]HOG21072.1 ATP-dependent 6-phosphofructokinase [Flexilinea sp.]HOG60749.1 ATP-dependent 6-phosphofructokinase [Flexilinea sp.]